MIINKKKSIDVDFIADIQCDCCGKSCKKIPKTFEFATLNASWGYYSDSDGKNYKIELCEDCFYDTIAHLKARCSHCSKSLDGTHDTF